MSLSSNGSDCDEADVVVEVSDMSQAGEARRRAADTAFRKGFDETGRGQAALVATEAATNIVKHGGRGEIVLRSLRQGDIGGLEIIAVDQGPGMADPDRCFRDGFSTAGTAGNGLGAIRRLSRFVDLYSRPNRGTALVARLWAQPVAVAPDDWNLGVLCLAKVGEQVAGDAWATERDADQISVLVADGLGHGELAAKAARTATGIFHSRPSGGLVAVAKAIHAGLRSTRGAAIALATIDRRSRQLRYVGIGNISGAIVAGAQCHRLVTHNGTAGAEARKFQEFTYAFPPDASLIMHSDGLATHWKLDAYPGLLERDPTLVAAVLHRDFTRRRDDATVLVLREPRSERP